RAEPPDAGRRSRTPGLKTGSRPRTSSSDGEAASDRRGFVVPTLGLSDGRTLHYDDYGAGPLVVLLHGSPGSARAWERVGGHLAPRFRIVAPDLPGYGGSDPRPDAVDTDTAWVAGPIEASVGTLAGPAFLAGHSYGANVALTVAIRQRVTVAALALFEPVALPVLPIAGEEAAYAEARAIVEDYVESHERGDARAVRKMVDL